MKNFIDLIGDAVADDSESRSLITIGSFLREILRLLIDMFGVINLICNFIFGVLISI